MKQKLELGIFGIVVERTLGDQDEESGNICSDLGEGNSEVDGILSLVLSHAMLGLDVTEYNYVEGIALSITVAGFSRED